MKAELKEVDSPYNEARILKHMAMIQTVLIGPAKQRYSHLPLEIEKKLASVLPRISKNFW